jgi:acylphosphatase
MSSKKIQAVISGKVQGVGYRYFAVHAAQRLGLEGTVRNTASGDVEVNAHGDEAKLIDFISALQEGPSSAEVTNVRVAWLVDTDSDTKKAAGFHAVP